MQAITTKYLGPTNHRGSRIVARCEARREVYYWDYALSAQENHDSAARKLATALGWGEETHGRLVGGGLPDGTGNCYVFAKVPKQTLPETYLCG